MAIELPSKLTTEWCFEIAPGVQATHTVCTEVPHGADPDEAAAKHKAQVEADAKLFPPVECN